MSHINNLSSSHQTSFAHISSSVSSSIVSLSSLVSSKFRISHNYIYHSLVWAISFISASTFSLVVSFDSHFLDRLTLILASFSFLLSSVPATRYLTGFSCSPTSFEMWQSRIDDSRVNNLVNRHGLMVERGSYHECANVDWNWSSNGYNRMKNKKNSKMSWSSQICCSFRRISNL